MSRGSQGRQYLNCLWSCWLVCSRRPGLRARWRSTGSSPSISCCSPVGGQLSLVSDLKPAPAKSHRPSSPGMPSSPLLPLSLLLALLHAQIFDTVECFPCPCPSSLSFLFLPKFLTKLFPPRIGVCHHTTLLNPLLSASWPVPSPKTTVIVRPILGLQAHDLMSSWALQTTASFL